MEEKEIIRRIKLVYQDLEGVLANMRLLKRSGISPELQHILNEHIGLIDTDNHMLVRMIEDMERHQEQDSDTPNICQWMKVLRILIYYFALYKAKTKQ